jgi:hypothetical protein
MNRLANRDSQRRLRRTRRRRGAASLAALAMPAAGLFATSFVSEIWNGAMNFVNHLDRNGWIVVLFSVLLVGSICLRGYGSRSNY